MNTITSCNQWFSLTKSTQKLAPDGRNGSLVARTSSVGGLLVCVEISPHTYYKCGEVDNPPLAFKVSIIIWHLIFDIWYVFVFYLVFGVSRDFVMAKLIANPHLLVRATKKWNEIISLYIFLKILVILIFVVIILVQFYIILVRNGMFLFKNILSNLVTIFTT